MKKNQLIHVLVLILFFPVLLKAQDKEITLIPRPAKIQVLEGSYDLSKSVNLFISEEFTSLTMLLNEIPNLSIGVSETIKKIRKQHQTGLRLFKAEDKDRVDPTGYVLEIDETGVAIKAHQVSGMISGIYSLVQLSMLEGLDNLPFVRIEDKPRYAYRGLHLDVSRHFMPFNFLKKYIDMMALYKLNYLHWHLTDAAGWRLEIKQYPELTQKAAWRTHSNWKDWFQNGRQYIEQGHPNASGGFYTQAQVKELVTYANVKGITIIPEIEFPGHSDEVLAVFPELSCTGHAHTQGEFCLGNEASIQFMKNVLDEVIQLFPSTYIHIGGDEANTAPWKTCEKCQAAIKAAGLKNEQELQSHSIKKIVEYLNSKQRKVIGWDEIMEGGIPAGATIMNWRAAEHGVNAAKAGHDVIFTPEEFLYFDKYQSDPRFEPEAIGGFTPLNKVYAYEPVIAGIPDDKKKHILGVQGNVWTEYMPTFQQVEYMLYPRMLALAEVAWTVPEYRSWKDFNKRLQKHYNLLQQKEINYARPSYAVTYSVQYDTLNTKNTVSLFTAQYEPNIHYTVDGSDPKASSTLYNLPIELAKSATIKAASFLDSARVSPIEIVELDVHRAIGKSVTYKNKWETYAAKGEKTLTNGRKGSLSYTDGEWQGFTKDLDVIIDFERREEINSVAMNFMQVVGPGIFFPNEFTVLISDNGKNYRELGVVYNQEGIRDPLLKFQKFEIKLPKPVMARYVQIKATNKMKGFIFTDEIVIY